MKDFPRILSAYVELDANFEDKIARTSVPLQFQARQVPNGLAYFLLRWDQLRIEIDAKCRDSGRWGRRDANWQIRPAWDIYNSDEERFSSSSFEDRARLALDGNEGRGGPYALKMKHYTVLNEIAHGELRSTRIDVSAFMADYYLSQAALHRAT